MVTSVRDGRDGDALYRSRVVASGLTRSVDGPTWGDDGRLYVANARQRGEVAVLGPDGICGAVTLPAGSVAGGMVAVAGGLLIADHTGHNVLRVDRDSGHPAVLAHEPSMHQPNDLAVGGGGRIYATDPDWSTGSGRLWLIQPGGRVMVLEDAMGTTNGVELSPTGDRLFVNETAQGNVWAYDIGRDGEVGNKALLAKFSPGSLDGMAADRDGNLWVTRYGLGRVSVLSPLGDPVRDVDLIGRGCTNLGFGGPDGRDVFVTLDEGQVETFRVEVPGRAPLRYPP